MEENKNVPTPSTEPTAPADQTQSSLSKADIVRAATNSPTLSPDKFLLGGREFTILDLDYDNYLEFSALLSPLFEGFMGAIATKANVRVPGIDLSNKLEGGSEGIARNIVKFCKKDLPAMVAIACNMEALTTGDKSKVVDADWVKKNAKTPYQLAGIVFQQVNRNNMLNDFADFFVQILPVMKSMTALT